MNVWIESNSDNEILIELGFEVFKVKGCWKTLSRVFVSYFRGTCLEGCQEIMDEI